MVGVVGVGDGVRVDGVVLISSPRGRILFWWEEGEGEENLTLFMYKVQVYIQYITPTYSISMILKFHGWDN